MRTRLLPLIGLLLPALAATGCRSTSTAEDYQGQWRGDAPFINLTGAGTARHEWAIEADPTGRLDVTVTWKVVSHNDTYGHDAEGRAVASDTERMLGMVDFERRRFVLVETEESGTAVGELLPDGRLMVVISQPGEKPVVLHTTLTRTGS